MASPISEEVRNLIVNYAAANDGKIYAPVMVEEFRDVPFLQGPDRFDMIRPYLVPAGGTVLDIGSHWGYISQRLELLGFDVTAVEQTDDLYKVLVGLRDAAGQKFQALHMSIFDLEVAKFDIVIALNIFHHFLKKKPRYDQFLPFLDRLDCHTMIFQAHAKSERQMKDSYKNLGPEEFVDFISKRARLPHVTPIGDYKGRMIYQLRKTQP